MAGWKLPHASSFHPLQPPLTTYRVNDAYYSVLIHQRVFTADTENRYSIFCDSVRFAGAVFDVWLEISD